MLRLFARCILVVGCAQSAHGVRAGTATRRGDGDVQNPIRRPDRRVGGARTGDRDRSGRDWRVQESSHCDADQRRAHAAAGKRAAQRQVHLRKQRDKENSIHQFDRNRAVILGSRSVDSGGGEIPLITIDRGGRHIGEVLADALRAVRRQEVTDAT